MQSDNPLELNAIDLHKSFKTTRVVKGVSFSVRQGEVVGLLGPNGAGKTTSFYMVVGLVAADAGQVLLGDEDITFLPMHLRALRGISYLPQNVSIFRRMSVEDNLLAIMEVAKTPQHERATLLGDLLNKFHINHIAKSMGASLSGGERRRVEIARSLITKPKFLLLDEPFAGIDPLTVEEIQGIIAGLKKEGLGVLITDHNVRETLGICDRACILSSGEIVAEGSPIEISSNQTVKDIYLGENFTF
jgi:lipopolysaccharide export system ATP-binding protein